MDTKNLDELNPATLAALAKTLEREAKKGRDALEPGDYVVDTIVTLVVGAEVKVLKDLEGVLTPQKAKPWGLVHVLLEEVNKLRGAAELAGLDLTKIVALAEKVDKDVAKKAQEEANGAMAELKEPTRSNRKGAVTVTGSAKIPVPA